jgi:hypothetical protein
MPRFHLVVGLFATILVPAFSWIDGSGWLAWSMFSKSETYRVVVVLVDAEGHTRYANPTALASGAGTDAATFLAGSDHFRHAPVGATFRRSLPGLAALSCDRWRPFEARVTLEERRNLDAPVRTTTSVQRCDAGRARGDGP